MPDTSTVSETNGLSKPERFIDTIDTDDPEYKKSMMRPAAIKEDVNLMSQRRRVSYVLNSDAFRQELEEIVRSQCQSGDYPRMNTSLLSLQHISDLFMSAPSGAPTSGGGFTRGQRSGVIPINDLRGGDASIYSRHERTLRCKLASVYRLIDLFGWNSSIHNHVTARISRNHEHFLINPFGLLYHEITASTLIKIDSKGQILDPGSTVLGVNQSTWSLHSAVHSARGDIRCIIHLDTPATIAVSCMKSGLLPLCHEAMILGDIAYYSPIGMMTNGNTPDDYQFHEDKHIKDWIAERAAVSEALGPTARVLFLRSMGLFVLGETIEEAWHYATNAIVACDTQLLLASVGMEHLVLPAEKLKQKAFETWRTSDLGGLSSPEAALALRLSSSGGKTSTTEGYSPVGERPSMDGVMDGSLGRPWRLGELEFEAMMRHLDNAGCRTGHMYRQEAMASPHRVRRNKMMDRQNFSDQDEVQIPPAASSFAATMAYYYEDGAFSGDETETPKPSTLRRQWSEKRWFNTPNKYTKELIEPAPGYQPVSHWVSEREAAIQRAVCNGALPPPAPFHPLTPGAIPQGSTGRPATGTVSPLSPYNMFAPQGTNPKEYREQQRKVKAKYYQDTNTAGPQSRLLDGLTWDEARRVRDESLIKALGPKAAALVAGGAISEVPVAAASKAIIQRDIRDAAIIYDGLYSHQNPFEKITDEELEMYRREIELKNRTELATDSIHHQLSSTLHDTSAEIPTIPVDSLAVDSGAMDLESASETGPGHLRPPTATGTLTSEPSGPEDASEVDSKQKKKKRRFKLPSFSLKAKDKSKQREK